MRKSKKKLDWLLGGTFTAPSPILLEARNLVAPGTLTLGTPAAFSYDYYHLNSILENNEPPYADDVIITCGGTGGFKVGETLTATLVDLVIPNGKPAGTHVYRWYRCNSTQLAGSAISGATSSTYVLQAADEGKYIRCEVDVKQTLGANNTGETVYSIFTMLISSTGFNPIVDIAWDSAFLNTDVTQFDNASDPDYHRWVNRGTGTNLTQDGAANMPSYDGARLALRWTRASSQRLLMTNQGQTQPFEVWIKFRLNSLPGNMQLVGWTTSMFAFLNNGGDLGICGAAVADTNFVINTDYVVRLVIGSGGVATIEINHGSVINVASGVSVNGLGTGAGLRLGASSATTPTNHLDGWIYNYFIKDTPLSAGDQTSMWTWFGL